MGQTLVVDLMVLGCSVYAVWALMPAVVRRRLAATWAQLPLPAWVLRRLRQQAAAGSSCGGCHGCDASADKSPAQVHGGQRSSQVSEHPVAFYPRRSPVGRHVDSQVPHR